MRRPGEAPQAPLIHLNGSGREALQRDLRAAYDAGRAFLLALQDAAPNQRDYYPLPAGAWERARAEHTARMAAVEAAVADMFAIWEAIDA